MRLSIEITPEQHQRLKAIAALQGRSMKDYVLARVLDDTEDNAALSQLEAFLEPRIAAAQGQTITRSVTDIFAETLRENG
jgi:hypothetical protein